MALPSRAMPLVVGIVYAAVMCAIVVRYRRKFGRSPINISAAGGILQVARLAALIIFGCFIAGKAIAEAVGWYYPLDTVLVGPFPISGTIAMIAGAALVLTAIVTMGSSWEIPVGPEEDRPAGGLITSGVFRLSRNPIYLGMIVALIGWLLLIPSLLSLIIVVGAIANLHRQAIEEEKHMREAFGLAFENWARKVGRFVPWLGRIE